MPVLRLECFPLNSCGLGGGAWEGDASCGCRAAGAFPHGKNPARCSGVFPSVSCILALDVKQCVLVCSSQSRLLILEFQVLQVFGLALFFYSLRSLPCTGKSRINAKEKWKDG